jgi:microcompartment protein CcmL/EutN
MKKVDVLHMHKVMLDVACEIKAKYKAGAEAHGGGLYNKPVINFMNEEILDMFCYFNVLRDQWKEMTKIIEDSRIAESELSEKHTNEVLSDALLKVYNILTTGNAQGVRMAGD